MITLIYPMANPTIAYPNLLKISAWQEGLVPFLPWLMPNVVVALLWLWILDPSIGLMNEFLKVVGIDLVAAGDIDADDKLEAIRQADKGKKTYRKLVIQDNRLVGAILLGDIRGSAEIQAAIKAKKDIGALKSELANPDFDFQRL